MPALTTVSIMYISSERTTEQSTKKRRSKKKKITLTGVGCLRLVIISKIVS